MLLTKTYPAPRLSQPDVIMFDLDGTLVDTMFAFADIAAEVMNTYHDHDVAHGRKQYLETCGIPFHQQLEAIHPGHAGNRAASDEFERRKRDVCDAVPMDEQTRQGLVSLRERGITLVLSSNTGQNFVDEFIRREEFPFDLALGFGDGLAKGEPHVARTVREFGVSREDILFVGDSLKDGELSRQTGVGFVGRVGTFSAKDFERRFPGTITIGNVGELPGLFLSMQAIILAAGLGSRLGDATSQAPKALIEVAGKPLIHYAVRFARKAGASHIVVVSGFYAPDVGAFVSGDDPAVRVVENREYRKGNLISLRTGLPHIELDAGFLVMNTDHIYKPAIADTVAGVAASADEITGFCDFDRALGPDDMKVRLDEDQRIREIAKTLESWDAGYVGMTYIPANRASEYVGAIGGLLERQGDAIHVERILAHFAATETAPRIADISGHGWLEVDEPHELSRAQDTLLSEHWW